MLLVELGVQSVEGSPADGRAQFRPGYNALIAGELSYEVLTAALLEALYPSVGASMSRAHLERVRCVRVWVSFLTPDKTTWRVIHQLDRGAVQLLTYDSSTRQFNPAATRSDEVAALLQAKAGLPARREDFLRLYAVAPADLVAFGQPPEGPKDPASVRRQLEEVQGLLAQHERLGHLEYELDGLQKRKFEVDDELRARAVDTSGVAEARASWARLGLVAELPQDFGAQYESYLEALERRTHDLERWEAERAELDRRARGAAVSSPGRDWKVWASTIAGMLAFACLYLLPGGWRAVAIANLVLLGYPTWHWWQYLTARDEEVAVGRRLALSETRKEKILSRDAQAMADVEAWLRRAELDSPMAVKDALELRDRTARELKAAEAQMAAAKEDPRRAQLEVESGSLRDRIAQIEETLAGWQTATIDTHDLQRRAAELAEQLAQAEAGGVAAVSPVEAWFAACCTVLAEAPQVVAEKLATRAGKVLSAVSSGVYVGVGMDAVGAVTVAQADGQNVPLAALGPAPLGLATLALRAALVACLDAKRRQPLWLADLSSHVQGGGDVLLGVLRAVAATGQAIHVVRTEQAALGTQHWARFGAGA